MKIRSFFIKTTASVLLLNFGFQLIYPNVAYALTSGPTQPEVQSFEPVGTTDMVDLFTGDFNYNIPLLDVEGYPVNISYHGGVTMEQEASWVGLGWNINPGVINRNVRGVPDDFNGEVLKKELHIKDEKILTVGMETGGEMVGLGDPGIINLSMSMGGNVTQSNYRGMSSDFSFGTGVQIFNCISLGVNFGVGSQSGADVDLYGGLHIASSQIVSKDIAGGIGVNGSTGYNTRTGAKDYHFSTSANVRLAYVGTGGEIGASVIPVSMRNFVPVITNSNAMKTYYGRMKMGAEFFWCNAWGAMKGKFSEVKYDEDGSRAAYGYMYSENAGIRDIHDFTRDRDGLYNNTMKYLPMASMTYDVYSLSGQGTGGMFRPYRHDVGTVFDPVTVSTGINFSMQHEASIAQLFSFGMDLSASVTMASSGPWMDYTFPFEDPYPVGNTAENLYFKQGGEISRLYTEGWAEFGKTNPMKKDSVTGTLHIPYALSENNRVPKSTYVYFNKANEVYNSDTNATIRKIKSYISKNGFKDALDDSVVSIERISGTRKSHQISEIVQVQKDGKRYVFGTPVMNNIQKECVFAVEGEGGPDGNITYGSNDDTKLNRKGTDEYYSGTITPSYAHSYLLTEVYSPDYTDITGDGPSIDDLGSYTKFNYSQKSDDYRWRAPALPQTAQFNAGYLSDTKDNKGSYMIGSREQWVLHSIESKNYVAEFFTSARKDGRGVRDIIKGATGYESLPDSDKQKSYKLDSIKLYNKHERVLKGDNAVPIKTVYFEYSYDLCKGVYNADTTGGLPVGKLTLTKIQFKYGNSYKSMASPYQFQYSSFNPDYRPQDKDRWGTFKPDSINGDRNIDYPYVLQDTATNTYAEAWSLKKVSLPSGGEIEIEYESDDYSYVQKKGVTEMFKVEGVGLSGFYNRRGSSLYDSRRLPHPTIFFKRDMSRETMGGPLENYLSNGLPLYFSFNVKLKGNKYEQIRGYADVRTIGYCPDNPQYGFVMLKWIRPQGAGINVAINPITYTALNTGRYNLPHVLFDGADPNSSGMSNIMAGLKQSMKELRTIWRNPIVQMVREGKARDVNLGKSFIRLSSPDGKKKGGGHRVKRITLHDNWNYLSGGSNESADYGKDYKYAAGVASYEPLVGGDENPMKAPIQYRVQTSSNFPPNDAIDLYQQTPLGETLYPPGVVGYGQVTVSSIHKDQGRSSQAVDIYRYNTSKDYPIELKADPIVNTSPPQVYKVKKQQNITKLYQGYSLILNDMHGKPKSVEHYVRKVKADSVFLQKISHQIYKYSKDNMLKNIVLGQGSASLDSTSTFGIEADVTLDARQKVENTTNINFNTNINVSNLAFVVVPIPLMFPWTGQYNNEFRSLVTTKVIQKYGILTEIENYNEGAMTIVKNEVFDRETGQPVVTSVNNEFKDKEYTTNIPAYWGYKSMGPAYQNTGFKNYYNKVGVSRDLSYAGYLGAILPPGPYNLGDELYMSYTYNGNAHSTIAYVTGFSRVGGPQGSGCCCPIVRPKYLDLSSTYGWNGSSPQVDSFNNVNIKIIRSGRKNMLTDVMMTLKGFTLPFKKDSILWSMNPYMAIEAQAKEFAEPDSVYEALGSAQLNPFANGQKGMFRVTKEYTYQADRQYNTAGVRKAGQFPVTLPWTLIQTSTETSPCNTGTCDNTIMALRASYFKANFSSNKKWKLSRSVTQWSPYGNEVENKDALGNSSTAVYGYNEELPVGVAYDAKQGEVLFDGFEDYTLLRAKSNLMRFVYSPFTSLFTEGSFSNLFNLLGVNSGSQNAKVIKGIAHTGNYCFKTGNDNVNLDLQTTNTLSGSYKSFKMLQGKKYIVSYWIKPVSSSGIVSTYTLTGDSLTNRRSIAKSPIIDGWQQVTKVFDCVGSGTHRLGVPANCYLDDIRVYPINANMKSFVYDCYTEKLMATLDENNYATFYEYDQEGNLVRTKRETEKGIMTISESRSAHKK